MSVGIPKAPRPIVKPPRPVAEPYHYRARKPDTHLLYDLEAEEEVLGAMLCGDNYALTPVLKLLRPVHFCGEEHGKHYPVIFDAIARTWARKLADGKGSDIEIIEPIVVGEELKRMAKFSTVGGRKVLQRLAESCSSSRNVNVYTRIVYECAMRRGIAQAMDALRDACYAPNAGEYLTELVDATQFVIADLKEQGYSKNYFAEIPLLENR